MSCLESDIKTNVENPKSGQVRPLQHSIYAELDFLRSYHVAASLCTAGFKVKDAEEIVGAMNLLIKHKIAIPTTKITGELLPTEVQQCHDRMKKVMIEQEQLNRMFDNDSLICQVSTGIDYIEVEVHELLVDDTSFLTRLYGKEFGCKIEDAGRKSLNGKQIYKRSYHVLITGAGQKSLQCMYDQEFCSESCLRITGEHHDQIQKTKRRLLISIQRLLALKNLDKNKIKI